MRRFFIGETLGLIKCFTATATFLCAASLAAAEEDTQLWIDLSASIPVDNDTRASVQITPRLRLDETANDLLFLRAGVDHSLSDFTQIGGGLILLGEFGPTEIRPYQYLSLGDGPLTFRTMAEQRAFAGADRVELRFRQRVQVALPLARRTTITASGEVFYTAQTRDRGGNARITQWRAWVQMNRALSPKLRLSAGYLAMGVPRPVAEDRLSHIPTLGLSYRF